VRIGHLVERVGATDDGSDLIAGQQVEQIGNGSGQELGPAQQVREPEADDPVLCAIRLAGAIGVGGWRPAIPKTASRPSGASAARLWSNTDPPVISRTMSTPAPPLASRSASRRLSVVESTATSAPRSRASWRLSSSTRWRSPARAPPLGELHRDRADPAGRGVHDDALAGLQMGAGLEQVPGGSALDEGREAAPSSTPSGIGTSEWDRSDALRVPAAADQPEAAPAVRTTYDDLAPGMSGSFCLAR